jgi:hypothetical protein
MTKSALRMIMRSVQDDNGRPIRLTSPDELMVEYIGINGAE